ATSAAWAVVDAATITASASRIADEASAATRPPTAAASSAARAASTSWTTTPSTPSWAAASAAWRWPIRPAPSTAMRIDSPPLPVRVPSGQLDVRVGQHDVADGRLQVVVARDEGPQRAQGRTVGHELVRLQRVRLVREAEVRDPGQQVVDQVRVHGHLDP